jgi:aminoglycoside-2''-adenylyltransferase
MNELGFSRGDTRSARQHSLQLKALEMPQPFATSVPDVDAWHAWSPADAAQRLAGVSVPWCVAGGWALDLWRGRQTRPHEDLEIAVLRSQFECVRMQLKDLALCSAGYGQVTWLPADAQPPPERHQVWVLEESARAWRMDILLEPGDAEIWVFRRDETIRRSRSAMVGVSADGIPYLRPEGVLLYKAKASRPKDDTDFAACVPLMDGHARGWLKEALQRAHPGHRWLSVLG